MPYATCLVADHHGQSLEVEQVDLFRQRIGEKEFNIAIHPEPGQLIQPEARRMVVSLYETGCKLATLTAHVGGAIVYGAVGSLGADGLRPLAQESIQNLADEIGCDRLVRLLDNSLTDHQPLNA